MLRKRRKAHVPQPQIFTFPEMAALTNEDIDIWNKPKRTAFLQHCLVGPDVVVECQVPVPPKEKGREAKPYGQQFARKDVEEARSRFRSAHFPKAQRKKGTIVVCPWPKCQMRLQFRDTGRHLDIVHLGMVYECPRCPTRPDPPINRTDSVFRHMRGDACEEAPRKVNPHPLTPASGNGEYTWTCFAFVPVADFQVVE